MGTALYFTTKDIGPWRSEKTRINTNTWPSVWGVINVGGIQVAGFTIVNTLLWFALPYINVLPKEAPTLLEFVRDLSTTLIISDFLMFFNHFTLHKVKYFYRNVHYVHHQYTNDMFSWSTGWAHPIELTFTFILMVLYPWILFPVHPLVLWAYACAISLFLVEEHSGHDVWWSPHNWVPAFSVVLCLMKFTTSKISTTTDLYSLFGIKRLERICHPANQPIIERQIWFKVQCSDLKIAIEWSAF